MGDIIDIDFRKTGARAEQHATLLKEFRVCLKVELAELLTDSVLAAIWEVEDLLYASFKPEHTVVQERIDRIYELAAKGIIAAA